MNISERERRMLSMAGVSIILSGIFWIATSGWFGGSNSAAPKVVAPVDSVERAEKMLTNMRRQAATIPGKEAVLKQVSMEMADREKGLIKGDTAPQAQAQLVQILREVARNQTPPLDIKQVELGQAQAFGDSYGEVSVSVTVDGRIDQLVNYLTYLSAQPEIIATDQIRFNNANPKLKTSQVRLTIAGLVSRKLVPAKRGVASF